MKAEEIENNSVSEKGRAGRNESGGSDRKEECL